MQNESKILIAVPTCDLKEYCCVEFVRAIVQLPFDIIIIDNSPEAAFYERMDRLIETNESRAGNFYTEYIGNQFLKSDSSRKRLTETRNQLRKFFLEGRYEFYLSLESDVIVTLQEIERLLVDYQNGIFGALLERGGHDTVVSKRIDYEKGKRCQRYNYSFGELDGKIVECKGIHLGCTLIPREILEKIEFRYEKEIRQHDDSLFSVDVIRAGYKIFCDGNVKPKHYWRDWPKSLNI